MNEKLRRRMGKTATDAADVAIRENLARHEAELAANKRDLLWLIGAGGAAGFGGNIVARAWRQRSNGVPARSRTAKA